MLIENRKNRVNRQASKLSVHHVLLICKIIERKWTEFLSIKKIISIYLMENGKYLDVVAIFIYKKRVV